MSTEAPRPLRAVPDLSEPRPGVCSCDFRYYNQHDDPGCVLHVEPYRPLLDRLRGAWREFMAGRWV